MSSHIPLHRISQAFGGEVAMIRHINELTVLPETYPHKDDYYIFLLIREGAGTMMVDFQEYEVKSGAVRCILPGQVHFPVSTVQARGWFLAVDPMFVKSDYKHLFEKVSLKETIMQLDEATIDELEHAALAIQKRLGNNGDYIRQRILHDLLHYYIGIIAEIYQKGSPIPINKSTALITFKFKALLSANFQTIKRPAEYASQLNITPAYLNEAVKKTTGLTVSDWIQYEIILQAKRLLYYTSLTSKEIAHELGYEDHTYFTRLFTKVADMSPGQFRKKYLK